MKEKKKWKIDWKHLFWIIPLIFCVGYIFCLTNYIDNVADGNTWIHKYCLESQYDRYNPLEINLNLSFTQLQDGQWYWCTGLNNNFQTYAFHSNKTNSSYGLQVRW